MDTMYNETDAAIFVHKNISAATQKKYATEQIEHILDLIYEYYDSLDIGDSDDDFVIDSQAMTEFINENMNTDVCQHVVQNELEEILNADNAYMESIGIIEPENDEEENDEEETDEEDDDELVNIDELVEDLYPALPQSLQEKYSVDEVYAVLCMECDFLDNNDIVDDDELTSYIEKTAKEENITISRKDIGVILAAESDLLGE